MKRFVAILIATIGAYVLWGGVADFNNAKSGVEVFKALFWVLMGTFAVASAIEDFRNNKWPFSK